MAPTDNARLLTIASTARFDKPVLSIEMPPFDQRNLVRRI
jgi:hypothetical protein